MPKQRSNLPGGCVAAHDTDFAVWRQPLPSEGATSFDERWIYGTASATTSRTSPFLTVRSTLVSKVLPMMRLPNENELPPVWRQPSVGRKSTYSGPSELLLVRSSSLAGTRMPGHGCLGEHFSGFGPVMALFPQTSPAEKDRPTLFASLEVEYQEPHSGHRSPLAITPTPQHRLPLHLRNRGRQASRLLFGVPDRRALMAE